ncbi:DUF421 domain-containing protein [Nocardioides islandensis]|jgi:uncharacterized membrane protein YcaP (DUF421 family)|uniref:DUF421 domain-containing protein n=1 Tax=Nocardioides islandensis TaxID=433663 RepID=A0A930YG79_9ACTN|nr:YetF domain-containing protein [Nocardioides islandensis]MBF4765702.1 DUF421 domain-containing protein [Nocardioides islandensis]
MELVVRAAVVFVFLWVVTRAVGRSTLGELSTFELLLYVTMGDLVQQAVTQQDYSLTGGMLAVGTFALLTLSLSWVQWRFPRVRPLVTGRALVVFQDGRPVEANMRTQRLGLADLLVAAREEGIRHTAEIEYAVMEADGRISFFTRQQDDDGAPEKSAAG